MRLVASSPAFSFLFRLERARSGRSVQLYRMSERTRDLFPSVIIINVVTPLSVSLSSIFKTVGRRLNQYRAPDVSLSFCPSFSSPTSDFSATAFGDVSTFRVHEVNGAFVVARTSSRAE